MLQFSLRPCLLFTGKEVNEVAYYDYGGPFWYRRYPCVRETYDDGNPDQLAYTEYYDENGTLTERVYPGEG